MDNGSRGPFIDGWLSLGIAPLSRNLMIATDVGSLAEDVIEGETGAMYSPCDPDALARAIRRSFASDLHRNLAARREGIRLFTRERHSWTTVAKCTRDAYANLLGTESARGQMARQ